MKFQIWREGAISTGEFVGHSYVGEAEADTFEEAVRIWYKNNPTFCFNEDYLTDWGCRHFQTEEEAMKLTNDYVNKYGYPAN